MAAVDPMHEHDEDGTLDRRIIDVAQLLSMMFEERPQLVHVFAPPPPPIIGMFPTAAPTESVEEMVAQARPMGTMGPHRAMRLMTSWSSASISGVAETKSFPTCRR